MKGQHYAVSAAADSFDDDIVTMVVVIKGDADFDYCDGYNDDNNKTYDDD